MKFEDLPVPTHVIRIKYPNPNGGKDKYVVDITYSIDPLTQVGVARFTLEAMQDIISIAQARGMDITNSAIADLI